MFDPTTNLIFARKLKIYRDFLTFYLIKITILGQYSEHFIFFATYKLAQ
jgi:hypothetical protein